MKKVLALVMCFVLVFSLAACGGDGGNNAEQDVYEIVWAGTLAEENVFNQTILANIPKLEEASGGRLTIKLYPNNQLGDSRSNIEQMQVNGSVNMGEVGIALLSIFTEDYNFLSLPFLFEDLDQMQTFLKTDYMNNLNDKLASETGVRILGYAYNGSRSLTNSKRPVSSPEDMKGLKIRVMESNVYLKMFEDLGATPVAMSLAEVFTGLQQGTIDGQDNAITNVISQKFDEVNKYYTNLGHVHDVAPILISEEYYQSMPEDLQVILQDWCDSWIEPFNKDLENSEYEREESIKDHVEVTRLTDEQKAAFRKASEPTYDWFKETYPDFDLDGLLTTLEEM